MRQFAHALERNLAAGVDCAIALEQHERDGGAPHREVAHVESQPRKRIVHGRWHGGVDASVGPAPGELTGIVGEVAVRHVQRRPKLHLAVRRHVAIGRGVQSQQAWIVPARQLHVVERHFARTALRNAQPHAETHGVCLDGGRQDGYVPPFSARRLDFFGIDATKPFALGVKPFGIDARALAVGALQRAVDQDVGLERIRPAFFQFDGLARG